MFNAEKPSLEDLPSTAQLIRSTVVAALAAVVLLVAVVLPAEYGIDPTGAGQVLGLTEMGEIKRELSEEAERDHGTDPGEDRDSRLLDGLFDFLIGSALAQDAQKDGAQDAQKDGAQDAQNNGAREAQNNGVQKAQSDQAWRDEIGFSLAPGETYEVKLTMQEGDVAAFRMAVEGGRVNYDLHAHGEGKSITYDKGRGARGAEGELVAAFPGDHGWFWRNRDKQPLTVTLQLRGTYSALKQGE